MSNEFILKTGLIAASLLATSIASAGVYFGGNIANYDFNDANTNGAGYVGYFTYGGNDYGVGQGDFNFTASTVPNGFTRIVTNQPVGTTGNKNVVYRFYKQPGSVVIGNIVQGDTTYAGRQFVKGVAGVATNQSDLVNGKTYNYEGVVFNHIPSYTDGSTTVVADGKLEYAVSVSGTGVVTGQGKVKDIKGNRPTVSGPFTINGDLNKVTFTATSGVINQATGGTTKLTYVDADGTQVWTDAKYDIGIFNHNKEVAGAITGGQLQTELNGYGIAGELKSVTP